MDKFVTQKEWSEITAGIRNAISSLNELESSNSFSVEIINQKIADITDQLLDTFFKSLNLPQENKIFPISDTPPTLRYSERKNLIDASQNIISEGHLINQIVSSSEALGKARSLINNNDVTRSLKSTIVSICTLSDFTFPTHEIIEDSGINKHFRIIVDDDIEYRID